MCRGAGSRNKGTRSVPVCIDPAAVSQMICLFDSTQATGASARHQVAPMPPVSLMIHLIGEAPLVTYLLDAPIDALAVALAGAPVCEYANHSND